MNASYHALQTSVEKRMSYGFTFLVNYTYSKSLDDLPFGEGVSGFDTGYSTLPFNAPGRHKFDYGPSSFDHTQRFHRVVCLALSRSHRVLSAITPLPACDV